MSSFKPSMSELDAVNTMLGMLGEDEVQTLEGATFRDAAQARRLLNNVSREIQSMGWHFNTWPEQTLTKKFPSNLLRWEIDRNEYPKDKYDFIRGGDQRIYNLVANDYHEEPVTFKKAVYMRPFENLPEPAKQYIVMTAGLRLLKRELGDNNLAAMAREDAQEAWINLKDYDAISSEDNIFTNRHVEHLLRRYV